MKITEARQKAKELWGVMAFAVISRYDHKKRVGKRVYYPLTRTETKEYYGSGETWEQAFDRAEKYLATKETESEA